jgi:hypothetical protein
VFVRHLTHLKQVAKPHRLYTAASCKGRFVC